MSWRQARLSDVCTFENGDRGKNYPGKSALLDEGIPFVNAGDLEEGTLRADGLSYISSAHYNKLSNGKFSLGDFLFCLRGSLGKFAIVNRAVEGAIASSLIIIRPQHELHSGYLKHYLASNLCAKEIALYSNGAAQPNLAASSLKQFKIPLPPLDEQRRIAAILDKADQLRQKRRQAIALLDSLTQSIFLEMFGHITNTVHLMDVCDRITDGTHQAPNWSIDGIPFLFVSNIRNQAISFESNKYVSKEEYSRLTKNCRIEAGDVLYTAVGSYGHAAVVPPGKDFIFQRHIAHIKPKIDQISPQFLAFALESTNVRQQADRVARGVAQKTVTLASLREFVIPLPNIDKQKLFEDKISKVRQLAFGGQFDHLNSLFSALQHRAFSGQL